MVRETRHLWVGNLPDNIREDRIREHFKRYGRVQNVKLLGRTETATSGPNGLAVSGVCATVAFMDIKSASKAHNAEHVLDERTLTTEYYEPAAIPSAAGAPSAGSSPAGSGYSGSSSSVNSASVPAPTPATVSRYHLSGGEEGSGTCALAATAAAPANWRGTNDSASEYCRRGNTPAAYGRYQRNNSTAPYSTPPSNVDRSTPHHRWYASGERERGATGGESTPSTPGGGTEGGGGGGARRRQRSGSGSSRSDSSSPEPSDASRASTPAAQPPQPPHTPHSAHATPTSTANRTPPTTTHHQWSTTTSGRPLAICVRNLPTRSTDSSLKDGLYHEYKKHGKVMWVKVVGQNADRYAVVRFKKPSDVEKALEVSQDKLFFGCKISVAPHQSCDEDAETAKPYETDIDEYHPKATRTLFIGNLEKDVTQQQLREKFKHFGRIIEIDIKKGSGGGSGYAFCQYASISSVVDAIRAMDGEHVGGSRVKLGFGKPVATTCVFVDGLTEHTEKQVLSCISRCGAATSVCVDRAAGAALIHFEQAGAAGAAVRELRRVAAHASAADPDRPRLAVDYASRECQDAFYDQLEKHGGSAPLPPAERVAGEVPPRYVPAVRHDPLRYDSCSSRSRASSYGRASSRTPRYPSLEHYEPADYAGDRRYRYTLHARCPLYCRHDSCSSRSRASSYGRASSRTPRYPSLEHYEPADYAGDRRYRYTLHARCPLYCRHDSCSSRSRASSYGRASSRTPRYPSLEHYEPADYAGDRRYRYTLHARCPLYCRHDSCSSRSRASSYGRASSRTPRYPSLEHYEPADYAGDRRYRYTLHARCPLYCRHDSCSSRSRASSYGRASSRTPRYPSLEHYEPADYAGDRRYRYTLHARCPLYCRHDSCSSRSRASSYGRASSRTPRYPSLEHYEPADYAGDRRYRYTLHARCPLYCRHDSCSSRSRASSYGRASSRTPRYPSLEHYEPADYAGDRRYRYTLHARCPLYCRHDSCSSRSRASSYGRASSRTPRYPSLEHYEPADYAGDRRYRYTLHARCPLYCRHDSCSSRSRASSYGRASSRTPRYPSLEHYEPADYAGDRRYRYTLHARCPLYCRHDSCSSRSRASSYGRASSRTPRYPSLEHYEPADYAGDRRYRYTLHARCPLYCRHDSCSSRSRASSCGRASSYGRASSRTPRYPSLEHYEPADYAGDRRYRVYDELGSSPQTEETPYEDRLQSVVVSPHRSRRHRRDSSPEDRKHSKDRHRNVVGAISLRRSRSGSRGGERHATRRRHRRRRDGSGSRGSRAGTPLRDEPDAPPSEPRRPPRDRPPLPMSLPLPRFAAQLLRAAPHTPRPAPAPAPASPPRPPSASSSSAGSAPHSPSLEERIRSLDEKYEKWSGCRAQAEAPDRSRLKHRLLEVDINEVKPSEVVRSLLAKRSVFDEDSERLEGAVRAPSPAGSPRARPPIVPLRAARYPFPAHPPAPHAPPAHPAPPVPPGPAPDVDADERPADPRLNRPERPPYQPEKLGKINESDYRLEPRARHRTPSTDKLQTDVPDRPDRLDRRPEPKLEKFENDRDPRRETERRRRDSLYGSRDDGKSTLDTTEKDIKEAIEKIDPDFVSRERRSSLNLDRHQKTDSDHHGAERRSSLTVDRQIKIEPDHHKTERRSSLTLDKHQKVDVDHYSIERRPSQHPDKHQKIEPDYHSIERRPSLSQDKLENIDQDNQRPERRPSVSLDFDVNLERRHSQFLDKHQKIDSELHSMERRPSLTLDKHQVEESSGSDDKSFSISPSSKPDVCEDKRETQTESSVTSGSDENDSRLDDLRPTEKIQESVKIELSTDKEPSSSDESSVKSDSIKSETSNIQSVLPKENDLSPLHIDNIDNKLDHTNFQLKIESDKCKDITIQNNISKELQEFELQHSHLNPINSIKTSKEVAELSHELMKGHDKNGKERFNQNAILEAFHTKLEKENIEFDKTSDKEKYANNSIYTLEKKPDIEKIDERSKHDREKVKHSKEKHEHDREKSRSIKTERSDKSEKEKRSKDDLCADKVEKIKTEKDSDKLHKEKNEKESDKKHSEEKSSRHEHHRKDKSERDKRKESDDKDTPKTKKEDKHKHDKSKKEGESKSKKDDSAKSRKSSRDESSRDLCRKDSTDSSASRASHDSAKIKDIDQAEPKDDKAKIKLYDMFIKQEPEKDVLKFVEQIKLEPGTIKIKSEIKEEKDLPEPSIKSKTNHILEPPFKCKPETIDKQRHYSLDSPSLECKRKERLNSSSSLPSHIGHKRRMSSQDSFDSIIEDHKKPRNDTKIPERRDSKDSRSTERHKTTKFNKGHFAKIIESKTKDDKKNQVKPPDDQIMKDDNKDSKKPTKKNVQSDTEERGSASNEYQPEGLHNDLDFLATLELRSSEEDEKQKALRKEMKEKKRIQQLQQIQELQMQQDAIHQAELMGKLKDDKKHKTDEKKKEAAREKRMSTDRKSRDEKSDSNTTKRKNRKSLQSTDTSDSDEPKKHSIFDIVDDEPTYISMYDKVKARSCKNMQKQEEEKRQEKIKAKFSQLKQSRAKREEKKRSSWDEDSDSENDRRKPQKLSMDSSSGDEQIINQSKKHDKSRRSSHDYERMKVNDYYNIPSNEEDSRNKLSRKNSRTRIISDTSDDEMSKRSISKSPNMYDISKGLLSHFDSQPKEKDDETPKESTDKIKKNSLLHLFGKSDSDDNKFKIGLEINDCKPGFLKTPSHDFSSESESTITHRIMGEFRKKHKKKQKNKYKIALTDDESRVESSDALPQEGDHKSKSLDKFRRHNNKKEKRKDKIRESFDADDRDDKLKNKKDKKSTSNCIDLLLDPSSNNKKDGKMEDIFGPLTDESEKDETVQNKVEFSSLGYDTAFSTANDQSRTEETKSKEKEEFRRKKEKKRKDRRPFVKEDDNSLDVDAVGKAIEARLFADAMNNDDSKIKMEPPTDTFSKPQQNIFSFTDSDIAAEAPKLNEKHGDRNRRENKEKRKKKKRNREDRRKEHHHSSSHAEKYDKCDLLSCGKSAESVSPKSMLLDIPLPNDTHTINLSEKSDDSKSLSESPSLPRLTDSPPIALKICDNIISKRKSSDASEHRLSDNDMDVEYIPEKPIEVKDIPMPQIPYENNIVQDLSEVPLPKDPLPAKSEQPKQDNFLPSFGCIDTSKDAVRSISNLEDVENPVDKSDHANKVEKKVEEKPRAVISQEETADAVAALLGESFGGKENTFSNCYEEDESDPANQVEIESSTIENENILEEDAEEMRRAVQNLNASEMDVKPDTPLSDNDLLLIDTDTEEAEEPPQDTIDRTPATVIPTSQPQSQTVTSEPNKSEEQSKAVTKPETPLIVTSEPNQANVKPVEAEIKSPPPKRDNVSQPTSTATPVITSWTLTNKKLIEPHVVNIQANQLHNRDASENKPTHITANIVQIRAPHSQGISSLRPIITPTRVSAPYQVINHMIRPQAPNMQPPTIKIPEPHIIYQKPPSIVISPRMANDPRQQSPKASPQGEGMTSPRLSNMTILSTSPQNLNSVSLVSPNALQQRSPGQVTVVRMQQPPLSPIQSMHLPPGARTMVSPNRPNSVLVQTQGGPIHFNRLPVTPVLAPISKQMSTNIVQQNKSIGVSASPLLHQQKLISSDSRKIDQRNAAENVTEHSKIILSPTSLQHSTNPTVMAQNRLISMQNAIHAGNMNSPLHFGNKVLINNMSQLGEKRENHIPKSEHHNHLPFGSTPIIHVANVNHSSAQIIQAGSKPVTLQDRGPSSNVIHTLNSQRLLTTAPVTSVIQMDTSKSTPTVLSLAAIRSPSVLTKIDSSNSAVITTASHTNVVTTPLLLKTTTTPSTIRLGTRIDSLQAENPPNVKLPNSMPRIDDKSDLKIDTPKISNIYETFNKQKNNLNSSDNVAKCETDFEELLKDNTNEIKVTNDPDKKLEVNVGKTTTLIERKKSVEIVKEESPALAISPPELLSLDKKELVSLSNQSVKDVKDLKEDIKKETEVKSKDESSTPAKDVSLDSGLNKVFNEEPNDLESKSNINVNDNFFGVTSDQSESDNQIKSLDENDSWSAKDVNIESVIKKVDSLCNDSPDTDKNMEVSETPSKVNSETEQLTNTSTSTDTASDTSKLMEVENESFEINPGEEFNTEKTTTNKRGGRNVRGKRGEKNQDRVQTRQISKPARGAASAKRGRGRAKVDKKIKNLVNNSANNIPGDVYDFHEDSGDETSTSPNKTETRPRLILTIKSPLAGQCTAIPTSTLSITPKEQPKVTEKENKEEKPEDFVSPSTAANTRKSRRLLEKDVQRSTVDDVIEDVVKGTATKGAKEPGKKRQTRQAGAKVNQADKATGSDTRKSPRGVKRTRDRSLSDASVDSSDEKVLKRDEILKEPKDSKIPKLAEPPAAPKIEPDPPQPAKTIAPAPVTVTLPSNPTPIMKPPKKMLSEIAKLTSVFEAAASAPPAVRAHLPPERIPIEPEKRPLPVPQPLSITPAVSDHLAAATGDARVNVSTGCGMDSAGASGGEAALVRRLEGPTGSGGMPVGATEASDARVQSPALPHRPPSAHRLADRGTPLLIRGGDGEGASMAAVGSGAAGGGARLPRGYAGTASLPRGAHHPAPPQVPHAPHAPHAHPHPHAKQVAVVGPHHHHPGAASRVTITSVPTISPQGQMAMGEGMYPHFSHQHYQMYQQHFRATQHESRATPSPYSRSLEAEGCEAPTPPLELRRPPSARVPRPAHSPAPAPAPSPADRLIMYAAGCGRSPPPAHGTSRLPSALPPTAAPGPPHASQVPREADSLQMLLRRYPVMWQGLLALKNDAAAVQMHFVGGNPGVAGDTLPRHTDGSTPPLRIAQRMRLEPAQLDQVHRKMKLENEHCILLALPCGRDHMDVLQQSTNLTAGFITYLQRKQAAGIVNVAPPGHQQAMYTVHIFPSCDFANENLNRIAPDLMHRVADIAHLLIVIATV